MLSDAFLVFKGLLKKGDTLSFMLHSLLKLIFEGYGLLGRKF